MAKRQGPRPTVRVSREPGTSPLPPRPTIQRLPPSASGPRASEPKPPVRFAPPAQMPRPPRPLQPPSTAPLPKGGGRIVSQPAVIDPRNTPLAPIGDERLRLATPTVARSATVRSREASLRLFGDYSYVKRDLRKIATLTVSALILLVLVSLLLPHWLA